MRKLMMSAVVMATLAGLAGCATKQGLYGNYAEASLDANKMMADATVAQLVSLYPPAHTRFNLQQPTTDAYGSALLAALRDKGYSVQEHTPQPQAAPATYPGAVPTSTPQGTAPQQLPPQPAAKATPGNLAQPVTPAPAKTEPAPPLVPTTKTEAQTIPATGSIAPTIASPAFIPEAPPVRALTPEQGPTERYRITVGATMPTPTRPPGPAPATVGTVNITQNSNTSSEGALATTDVLPVKPATWSARAGMHLSELIAEWGRQQGWTVRWDTQLDYPIEAAFDIQAESFLDAANEVFGAYQDAQEPFSVTAYANNVLIVKGLKR